MERIKEAMALCLEVQAGTGGSRSTSSEFSGSNWRRDAHDEGHRNSGPRITVQVPQDERRGIRYGLSLRQTP